MQRRDFLKASAAAGAGILGAPHLAASQGQRVLRFAPQADLAILDPITTTGFVTRNHAFLVFDTLYGWDEQYRAQPQMVEGHAVEDDGRTWTMTLREGLRFHDGEPVRARDVVASLRRWGRRDQFGLALMAVVEEVTATSDRVLRWRLKQPFPLLPDALAKVGANVAFIMPERLADTDAAQPISEMVGSGPYRFVAQERVAGSRNVYARFEGYVPRAQGAASLLAGPKLAHFDRVEWLTIPDASTAAAALQRGEIDWWEQPTVDLLPVLRRGRGLKIETLDPTGAIGMLRFNHLHPPFDNVGIRRAVLGAVSQADVMTAVAGTDRALWQDGVGFFAPGSIMASDEGMQALTGPRDLAASRRALEQAGYKGEKVLLMAPTDFPAINAMSEVVGDVFRRLGLNLDYAAMDWGSALTRQANREPVERGGYSAFCTYTAGINQFNPAAHNFIRGSGLTATFGWSTSARLEELRNEWLQSGDDETRRRIGRDMQRQAFADVPYVPLGQFYQPTAYREDLSGVLKGLALFWNVRRG
ncbi:ABC transporter substrate-binding protein [Roseomonas hellenica]|uniref:ABC transporter substrate-binding protein n=1 Tax=Plastoroseomonas hellenica TaxID=2687306 RepID=A0ABS5F0X8_9PROT|nr:ABC transporter substrate-binding protein [Plastoroseomonas hellenica]MBR0666189.1 ABC transporter substrate-binding protein [Plastoroseomonas hellenica]